MVIRHRCSHRKTSHKGKWVKHHFTKRIGQTICCSLAISIFSSPLFAAPLDILENKLSHNIPAQTLAVSIADVAEQAGLIVLLAAKDYQQNVVALTANLTVGQALQQLLTANGYTFEIHEGKRLVIKPIDEGQQESSVNLPDDAETTVVYGTQLGRYEFDEGQSATGFDVDIDELPRAVQVLPEQLILDQSASDLTDLLVNAAGVTRAHGFGGTETQVNIRGFTNSHLFVDGHPVSNRYNIDLANVESAEVVLGPASVLHGQVSPGGLVNVVTKKPQVEKAGSLQLELDDQGKRRISLDTTGPLTETLQYRVILSGEDSETFREVNTSTGSHSSTRQTFNISPSISFTPDAFNTYTLSLTYGRQELPIDRGTVAIADASGLLSIADTPVSRRFGGQLDQRTSRDTKIQFDWDRELASGWKNSFKAGYYEKSFDDYQTRPVLGLRSTPADFDNELAIFSAGPRSSSVQDNGLLVRITDSNPNVKESDFFLSDSITGDYSLAGIENTLYVGANFNRRKILDDDGAALVNTPRALTRGFGFGSYYYDLSVIDVNSANQAGVKRLDQTLLNKSDEQIDEYGLSVQNFAHITENLNLLTGLRYDRFEFDKTTTTYYKAKDSGLSGFDKLASPETSHIKMTNDNVSGQAGLLYKLNDNVSIYGSYSESFKPNYPDITAGVTSFDSVLDPEEASQYELGIKSSLFDDKLRFSVAAYNLRRKNVLKYENLTARLNGEERTRGVDLSSTIQLTKGLNILGSISYMDSEIIDDGNSNGKNEGNRPYSIPKHKARVWGSYEFQGGKWAGLGLGAGVEYVGKRYGNDANTLELPSYSVMDTALWYYVPMKKGEGLRIQAGIKNVANKRYYTANGSGNAYRINVGDPRTVYMNLRYEF